MAGMGIVADLFRTLYAFLRQGRAMAYGFVTNGNAGTNAPVRIPGLETADRMIPQFTVVNANAAGGNSIRVGANGILAGGYGVLITAGGSATWRWINPKQSNFVYSDLGHSGTEIDVFG